MLLHVLLGACCLLVRPAAANTTEYWLGRRAALIDDVYGKGPGVLPTQSVPDQVLTWPEEPGLQGLVWNLTTHFEITSTVFYSQATKGKKSKSAVLFHHGHSDCVCPGTPGDPVSMTLCKPGCNSSMPSLAEIGDPGYSWWDLYNVSKFYHSLGHDVFILSMPLKGVNLGPGSNSTYRNEDHWWFYANAELKGDPGLRYFLEPAYLTVNYAEAQGYEDVYMAGLSGGGWSTTFAAAIDKRIKASFPIAGSVPCGMRNPESWVAGQNWTGDADEDYEQNCRPNSTDPHPDRTGPDCRITKDHPHPRCPDAQPGRPAFGSCNYTCQYLLAGLEPGRFQVQVLHEYDTCCFSPHGRHEQMLAYERDIRSELAADDRAADAQTTSKHGCACPLLAARCSCCCCRLVVC